MTINVAKQMFIEDERGSISTGKYADFLLLNQDVLTCPVNEIHCALLIGVCVIILSISIITGNTFADALSDGINALGEGFFALLMGEVFGIGLKLKEAHKGV